MNGRLVNNFRLRGLPWFAAALAFCVAAGPLAAQQVDQAVGRHLAAGEFGPAMALANSQPPGAARDRMLAQVAAAQARAGMRRAGVNTAGGISGSLAFEQALRGVAASPVGNNFGNPGGANQPDFDSLMELIRSTIAPATWREGDPGGGEGSISPFEGGVRVDTKGLVHSLVKDDKLGHLAALRRRAGRIEPGADVRQPSILRKVSLNRLERAVQMKLAAGEPLDEAMLLLAGLQKIKYVLVYPDSGDIVLAGPAGDWRTDREGRLVGDTGDPVLRLDDLVVLLRHATKKPGKPFGCSITPQKANLARTQAFLDQSNKKPLRTGQRGKWLKDLRDQLGQQRVEFYGVDPRTRVGRVLLEADYRMKLIGIGLERGTADTPSYLSMIKIARGQAPPPMGLLRWWFTLNYNAILASQERDAYEIRGQGVQVLSENELLDKLGNRIHTGKSDPLTAAFAKNFTKHFPGLAKKYPIYAELRNIFDLALVSALIRAEDLPGQVDWRMSCFNDPEAYQVALGHAPQMVESVINHRVINRKHITAAVSGGVRVDPSGLVKTAAIDVDGGGALSSKRDLGKPKDRSMIVWWWD